MSAVDRFPEGWKCTDDVRDVFDMLEPEMRRLVHARAVDGAVCGVDVDDLVQEGRVTLLRLVSQYDWSRSRGKMIAFVNTSLGRAVADERRRVTRKEKILVRSRADDDDPVTDVADDSPSQEDVFESAQRSERVSSQIAKFCDDLRGVLGPDDYAIFCCRVWPPAVMSDNPTNNEVARHLGLSRQAVANSVRRARAAAVEMLGRPEWADLGEEVASCLR